MKRQKFYLGILVVFLCLFLLGLWGLFFTGRFSLVADLILQPGIGARQEFKAQEILSESYF